jgi:photosystem II stability/assembly factor-like uncharacterized protein
MLNSLALAASQLSYLTPLSQRGMVSNSLSTLVWDGQRFWATSGSGISKSLGLPSTALDWVTYTSDDGLPSDIVPALTVSGDRVYVSGAEYQDPDQSYTLDFGSGLAASDDGGQTWQALPLDRAEGLGNICWQLAAVCDTVWAACWNGQFEPEFQSGIAVSTDRGLTWAYPDVAETLGPLSFSVAVRGHECWVGTGQGLGRTTDLGQTWQQISYENTNAGITGDWVVAISLPDHDSLSVWAATRAIPASNDQAGYGSDGVSFSTDGGVSWQRVEEDLAGVNAWDFAFSNDTVWVATEEGLGFSPDGGVSWSLLGIESGLPRETFYSVAVVGDRVYAGSSEGLVWSTDRGETWDIMLASQPVGTLDEPATYSYPNPFSPSRGQEAKIRYSLANDSEVTLEIFDFREKPVCTIVDRAHRGIGSLLYETWDGYDSGGAIVANGTYFYRLSTSSGTTAFGKILVID